MPAFIQRVRLRNYKSIASCDVALRSLVFLVGPNGAGKSNFLDALRLTRDALRTSLDHALRDRGGVREVRRKSGGHPTHFAVRLDFMLPDVGGGHYAFSVSAEADGGFAVSREECAIGQARFEVSRGEVKRFPTGAPPPAAEDRLFLVHAAGFPPFRAAYDALSTMGFYNLRPARMRDLQTPDPGDLLTREGDNLPSVIERLRKKHPGGLKRVEQYLARIVAGLEGVDPLRVGPKQSIEFRQRVEGQGRPWRFPASNMSDGTLRALGILVALFQEDERRLIAIEEPETALHPAAAGILLDALREASAVRQVVVTSHSPDLLDDWAIACESILAVVASDGRTSVGPLDEADRSVLRDRLYSAGELLRANQLQPDPDAIRRAEQHDLFGEGS
jgi:predicted ATPase